MSGPDPEPIRASTIEREARRGALEPRHTSIHYPGGLSARMRWIGSGGSEVLFALSEVGGTLTDHGPLVSGEPDRLCRAELRVEVPVGTWTARLASPVYDEPLGIYWDTAGLLVVKYGFVVYAFEGRSGDLRWTHSGGTPVIAVLGSSRLDHVLVQSEVETLALDEAGRSLWRVAHSDVVVEAELVGGRLVLTSFSGQMQALDPRSGRGLEVS